MPKALIITYYWPPAGGSGVQRWLKFVKYFRDFGWEPVVYTALYPEAPVYDDSLAKDIPEGITVIRKPVPEPYSLYKKISGRTGERIGVGFVSSTKKNGIIQKIAVWIRGNFFIPDARMFWIRPSVKFLVKYLSANPVDIIISTGPPHSTHLIARAIKRRLKTPWLVDFRDPWTSIDFYRELNLTKMADRIHHRLEKSVVLECDAVVAVSASMMQEFLKLKKESVFLVHNGFDHSDYSFDQPITSDKNFTISHFGVVPPSRNCRNLWLAIKKLVENDPLVNSSLKVNFYGQTDNSVIEEINGLGLAKYFHFSGFIPHDKVVELQRSTQVLLLLVNNSPNAHGILTGKVFEYLAAKRPILAVGPKGGDLDTLIKETNAGVLLPFDNENEIFEGIKSLFAQYNTNWIDFNPKNNDIYSRKELTRKLVSVINQIIKTDK